MPRRIFLGYSSPFLPLLSDQLLEHRDSLPRTLVIVPTSQSGRILRESLAATASALLAPTVTTPGSLLHLDDPSIAPPWLEKIAWISALESLTPGDWEKHPGLLPTPPAQEDLPSDWAVSLASEITSLRTTLQDHLHNLFSASKFLANTPEAARWEALAEIEILAEKKLTEWSYQSRSTALRTNFKLPDYEHIVLAGITEMPACLATALESFSGNLTILIAAPESEKNHFSPLGIPLESWQNRPLPPGTATSVAANPEQQAELALEAVSTTGASSVNIALGTADDQAGAALARIFSASGWTAFHPAATRPAPSLVRWLTAWRNWLSKPSTRHLAVLLSLPESAALADGNRAGKLRSLNRLRDRNPTLDPAALAHIAGSRSPETAGMISRFLSLRQSFLSTPFRYALFEHLTDLRLIGDSASIQLDAINSFMEIAAPLLGKIDRTHTFWLGVVIQEVPESPAHPPAGRVIDIQGWLELLYEPGEHLIICGMNEGLVPSRSGGEPWLSENIRSRLGLLTDSDRHARDAYLLHAMLMMRRETGSAHLICGKTSSSGDTLLPSRLLLQVPPEELVPTVKNLFREIEPPEANLIWENNWKWETPLVENRPTVSVTALRTYLACPFRFYLNHLVRMDTPDPDRREMNPGDFGNLAHRVLQNWGLEPGASTQTDPEKIQTSLLSMLDTVSQETFGPHPPLAVRIQLESLRQRLSWFAAEQATSAADGWEIIATEKPFEIPSGEMIIKGTIDRIDRHHETGHLRVIDYKTGNVSDIRQAHLKKITASTRIPAHFGESPEPFHQTTDPKGKTADNFWQNLQLPLYALAESLSTDTLPIPSYVHLGKTRENVRTTTWEDFSEADLESARTCADWITSRITARAFWPPAEKFPYDPYAIFASRAPLESQFTIPESIS